MSSVHKYRTCVFGSFAGVLDKAILSAEVASNCVLHRWNKTKKGPPEGDPLGSDSLSRHIRILMSASVSGLA